MGTEEAMGPEEAEGGLRRPYWPRPAASMAIFRDGSVLLVQRGKAPSAGSWSLPGGHIEPGETAMAAAVREVMEETGVAVELIGLVGVHDSLIRDGEGRLVAHYVLAVYCGHWASGEPLARSDVAAARFVAIADLGAYNLTPGASSLINRARAMAG